MTPEGRAALARDTKRLAEPRRDSRPFGEARHAAQRLASLRQQLTGLRDEYRRLVDGQIGLRRGHDREKANLIARALKLAEITQPKRRMPVWTTPALGREPEASGGGMQHAPVPQALRTRIEQGDLHAFGEVGVPVAEIAAFEALGAELKEREVAAVALAARVRDIAAYVERAEATARRLGIR